MPDSGCDITEQLSQGASIRIRVLFKIRHQGLKPYESFLENARMKPYCKILAIGRLLSLVQQYRDKTYFLEGFPTIRKS